MQENVSASATNDARLGVFDYLLFLLEHIRLLVIVTVIVAAVAYGFASSRPKSYSSTALVLIPQDSPTTPAQSAAMMRSQVVLERVAASRAAGPADVDALLRRVSTSVTKEGLVRLDVEGDAPDRAQATASAVLSAWLSTTVPANRDREDLLARIARAKADLVNVQAALDASTKAIGAGERLPVDATLKLAALSETADRLFTIIQASTRRLDGLGNEVVKQAPTLPAHGFAANAVSVAAKAALTALFVLCAGLLLLRRVQELEGDPVHGAKIQRLLGIFRRSKTHEAGTGG